jgi:uncharacterized protein (TIGR03437 family)
VAEASPGIFTLDRSGQGPAAALNQDNSVNAAANPARRGTVIQILATGLGDAVVRAAISGIEAQVAYAGPAPGMADGIVQVNAVIPPDAPAGPSVPIVLTAAAYRSQDKVTIAVQ